MFESQLLIEGQDYQAKGAARRLGLGRECYALKEDPIELGPRKGEPKGISSLRIPLSRHLRDQRHMRQLETRLAELMTFLGTERRRYGATIEITLEVGMTVGGEKWFIRYFCASPALLGTLGALGIGLSVNAYPCSDRTERSRLNWSGQIGLSPGLGK